MLGVRKFENLENFRSAEEESFIVKYVDIETIKAVFSIQNGSWYSLVLCFIVIVSV